MSDEPELVPAGAVAAIHVCIGACEAGDFQRMWAATD